MTTPRSARPASPSSPGYWIGVLDRIVEEHVTG
jgi:hypothetical protein